MLSCFTVSGFVDITQSTRIVVFMGTFKAKGLKVGLKGDGSMTIDHEGAVNKYVNKVYEKTFSGDEAVRRGQQVYYISERCVFRRTAAHDTIELIEIAPGINVQTDILDQMDFEPAISPNLKTMDKRLFKSECMDIKAEAFGSLEDRCTYNADDHVLYVDLFGVSHGSETDVRSFFHELEMIYSRCSDAGKNPVSYTKKEHLYWKPSLISFLLSTRRTD
jgi:propionate CoA-transferase